MGHTPEPWKQDWNMPLVVMGDGHIVAKVYYWSGSENAGEPEANARRIVACVNACECINPEAVPELLEALEQIASGSCCESPGCCLDEPMCDAMLARAAIAKAKGEPCT